MHGQATGRGAVPQRATFGDVFAVGEFRALWFSEVFSVAGDRLALVALTLLVYDRTRSPFLSAAVFAVGYLPYVIGGLFLADLADRRPRRSVMVFCNLVRAALVAVMVVPHLPLWVLAALLFAATTFSPVFDAARSAITPEILQGEHYVLGNAVTTTTILLAEVLGAAAGGVAVAFIGVRRSLVVDVATFLLSALFIGLGTRQRPPAARPEAAQLPPLARIRAGFRVVFGDRALRILLLFGWLVAFYAIPAGIAAPYVATLGGGPIAAGLVIASTSLGTAIAMPFFGRFLGPRRRVDWMGPLGRADLRDAGPDGVPPWACCLAGDLLALGRLRQLSDCRQHRVRAPDPDRPARSGLRHRQHGRDRRPRPGLPGGRGRRRGDRPGDGDRHQRRRRSGPGGHPDAQMAPRIAAGRAARTWPTAPAERHRALCAARW